MISLTVIVVAALCAAVVVPGEFDLGESTEARARDIFGGKLDACRASSTWHHW